MLKLTIALSRQCIFTSNHLYSCMVCRDAVEQAIYSFQQSEHSYMCSGRARWAPRMYVGAALPLLKKTE